MYVESDLQFLQLHMHSVWLFSTHLKPIWLLIKRVYCFLNFIIWDRYFFHAVSVKPARRKKQQKQTR